MDRDEFMELVYETFETFADKPDNVLANGIIEAADAYVEHEKAQLFKEGTTFDLISRQAAIDAVEKNACNTQRIMDAVNNLPPAQPEQHEGHWINGKCDLCGEHAPFWCMASTYHESNYCPNCGAKMTISTK